MSDNKNFSQAQLRRQRQLCRRLDLATFLLGAIILFTAMATVNADYDLSKSNPQGLI